MNNFLKYFLLSLAITITSCKQNHEKDLLDSENDSLEIIDIEYTIPIILSEEFKNKNIGFFSYIFIFLISIIAFFLIAETFEYQINNIFPNQYFF